MLLFCSLSLEICWLSLTICWLSLVLCWLFLTICWLSLMVCWLSLIMCWLCLTICLLFLTACWLSDLASDVLSLRAISCTPPSSSTCRKTFTFKENLCKHSNLGWVDSCYWEILRNIRKVRIGHLLDSVVAPALHELSELFEGDPISGRFDGEYIWSRYFEYNGAKSDGWTMTK